VRWVQGPAQELEQELDVELERSHELEVEVGVAWAVEDLMAVTLWCNPCDSGRSTTLFSPCSTSHPGYNQKVPGPLVMV